MQILLTVTLCVSALSLVLTLIMLSRQGILNKNVEEKLEKSDKKLDERLELSDKNSEQRIVQIRNDMHYFSMQTEQKLENVRTAMTDSISRMTQSNNEQLTVIRRTVDEKLQETLDKKLNDSFKMVSERLEQVYKGLGEMQNVAAGVGDLKKVLSNVKTRGVLGEIQLGAILEQILSPEQYEKNVKTVSKNSNFVEYAVKLPGDGDEKIWLPIDSKFPTDAYSQLLDAYDTADPANVDAALKQLKNRVKQFAKDICTKYVSPPETTDFAIMFLPTEGLYAELVRAGMVEELQAEFRVCIAGPTTMGALLNSLQMGFKTLAIQKRSNEVWKILSAVKGEFDTFSAVLEKAQTKISQANDELDRLVGTRTRMIQSKLKNLQALPREEAAILLEDNDERI
ncbi:MAG: DNA recombination protein RmuC [Clostridia bacterium]|nr:DNA recombination protein RmuC [Clostridia bacterium]